jgi:hypothetical protein
MGPLGDFEKATAVAFFLGARSVLNLTDKGGAHKTVTGPDDE